MPFGIERRLTNPAVAMPESSAPDVAPGFVPVWLSTLKLMGGLENDLYILNDGAKKPVLFRQRDYSMDEDKLLALLCERGIKNLYVKIADYTRYQQKLQDNLDNILARDDIETTERCGILQATVSWRIERAFRSADCQAAVEESQQIGRKFADLLAGSNALPADLFSMVRHDMYTFTHLTNVASYCVLLAKNLGISDWEELRAIAVGGLLHDRGMRSVPKTILNKRDRLSAKEYRIVQAHPKTGYVDLHAHEGLCRGQLMMVYQHHEKIDGTGYPVRITGEEIHPWARLCAVVDVFDAMTCTRPYRNRRPPAKVLEHLQSVAGTHLDKEMVRCWTSAMSAK